MQFFKTASLGKVTEIYSIRPCILKVVVISFHYMQIVEFVIDLRLLVCERDKTGFVAQIDER